MAVERMDLGFPLPFLPPSPPDKVSSLCAASPHPPSVTALSPAQVMAHASLRVSVEEGAGNPVVSSKLGRQDPTFVLLPPDVGIRLGRVSLAACVSLLWFSVVKAMEETFQPAASVWES